MDNDDKLATVNRYNSINNNKNSNYNNDKKFSESSISRRRLVLDTPFCIRNTISYGLIVYSNDTKKWLILQRKHSAEFLLFMRGMYRITHLPFLLSSIVEYEKDTIIKCLNGSIEIFKEIYLNELGLSKTELDYSIIRLQEARNIVLKLLSNLDISKNELSWSWPKGRLSYTQYNAIESPFDCAKKEFNEEVEIELPPPIFISDTYISDIFKTITGRIIESRYWIYIIPNEIKLPDICNNEEVADRRWVTTQECGEMLNNDNIFSLVTEIINRLE